MSESGGLFEKREPEAPLADRLRPRKLEDFVGQDHLLGTGKPLALAFSSRKPHSMILWGPPGSGKTSLARVLAAAGGVAFEQLSAVLSGVKDVREVVERAKERRRDGLRTLLFVD